MKNPLHGEVFPLQSLVQRCRTGVKWLERREEAGHESAPHVTQEMGGNFALEILKLRFKLGGKSFKNTSL